MHELGTIGRFGCRTQGRLILEVAAGLGLRFFVFPSGGLRCVIFGACVIRVIYFVYLVKSFSVVHPARRAISSTSTTIVQW